MGDELARVAPLRGSVRQDRADHPANDASGAARITVGPARWWELVRTDPRRYGWIVEHHDEAIGYLDAEQDTERPVDQYVGLERSSGRLGDIVRVLRLIHSLQLPRIKRG